MVYNRPLPCSLPLRVLRRSDHICRKHPFVVPPRAKKWIFLLCSTIVIRKCQISFLLYFNITTFAHVYESGAGCHVRNATPIIFWARGNVAMEQLTFYFLVYKEEQWGTKTTANPVVPVLRASNSCGKEKGTTWHRMADTCHVLGISDRSRVSDQTPTRFAFKSISLLWCLPNFSFRFISFR